MVMTRRKLPVDMALQLQWFEYQTGGHETDYGKQECVMFHQVAFNTKFFCFGQLIWIHKIKLMLKLANFLFDFLFEKSCRRQQQLAHLQKLPSCCCEAAAAFNCSCFQLLSPNSEEFPISPLQNLQCRLLQPAFTNWFSA